MQTSIKVCVSRTFSCHMPSMHKMDTADFLHTFSRLVQTLNRHYADCRTCVQLAYFSVVLRGKLWFFAGPTWRQRDERDEAAVSAGEASPLHCANHLHPGTDASHSSWGPQYYSCGAERQQEGPLSPGKMRRGPAARHWQQAVLHQLEGHVLAH